MTAALRAFPLCAARSRSLLSPSKVIDESTRLSALRLFCEIVSERNSILGSMVAIYRRASIDRSFAKNSDETTADACVYHSIEPMDGHLRELIAVSIRLNRPHGPAFSHAAAVRIHRVRAADAPLVSSRRAHPAASR